MKKTGFLIGFVLAAFQTFGMYSLTSFAENDAETEQTEDAVQVLLSDDGSTVSGKGASVSDNVISISKGGTYRISGSLTEGQIHVSAKKSDSVVLELDGAEIYNEDEPAIYIEKAGDATILLTEGSENKVVSGQEAGNTAQEEDAKGAAIYSKCDLILGGSGTLKVSGFLNNGIASADALTVTGGVLTVDAVNHGIKGNDAVTIEDGTLTVTSEKDGLHSERTVDVNGGNITISAKDDGIHADTSLTVTDGCIEIRESFEGLEGNQVTLAGGEIQITASDDGINAYGGNGAFNTGVKTTEETPVLKITGGVVYVNAEGDGLDSNGDLLIEGGTVIVDGPVNGANGAIDSGSENGGACSISGGTVLAIGASGMAESFDESSAQCSFGYLLSKSGDAGSEILITDEAGEVLMEHTAAKPFSSVVFSSPELEVGSSCILSIDGEITEIVLDSVSSGNSFWAYGFNGMMEGPAANPGMPMDPP